MKIDSMHLIILLSGFCAREKSRQIEIHSDDGDVDADGNDIMANAVQVETDGSHFARMRLCVCVFSFIAVSLISA